MIVEPSRDEKDGQQNEEQRRRAAEGRNTNGRVECQRTANEQWRRADGETRHEQRRFNKPAETNGRGCGRVHEAARQKAIESPEGSVAR